MTGFEKLLSRSRGSTKQFLVLIRHFFQRLFLNDFVLFEEQMKEKVITVIVFIAIFCAHISNGLLFKYLFIADEGTSWVEKTYLLCFIMVIMGFVSVIEWDIIFLDLRDYASLIPLPIKMKTIFKAKFTSLTLFIGMFALGGNILSALIFWLYLARWKTSSPVYGIRSIFAHFVSVMGASFSVFFLTVLIIGILMSIFGYNFFKTFSVYIRAVFLAVFVFLMFFFLSEALTDSYSLTSLSALKENNSFFLYLFPPMWFTGLYEWLLGNADPFFSKLALISLPGVIVPALAFFAASAIGFRKHVKKVYEVRKKSMHLIKIKTYFLDIFNKIFLMNPTQRAIFYFVGKTLRTSMLHKMRLAPYLAVPSGIMLIIVTSSMNKPDFFFTINRTMISIPLVISLFLLVGMRVIVNIPVFLGANWIFKLTEGKDTFHYFWGMRKSIIFFTLFPLFTLFFIIYSFLWGWQNASLHCLYGLAVSIFVTEIFFFNFKKIPFACSYLPGKGKMHVFWLLYTLGFISYVSFFVYLENLLFKAPTYFALFFGGVLVIFLLYTAFLRYFLFKKVKIMYEEEPEPVMTTLVAYDPL